MTKSNPMTKPTNRELTTERLKVRFAGCSQLVLFGSRAAGVDEPTSDWDVLFVGVHRRTVPASVDLVVVSDEIFDSSLWLGSELAGHVARYGQWLAGDNTWCSRVFSSRRAFDRKRRRIVRRIINLQSNWSRLREPYRQRFSLVVRRDLQRLECLHNATPVPPTYYLDLAATVSDGTWRILESSEEMRADLFAFARAIVQ